MKKWMFSSEERNVRWQILDEKRKRKTRDGFCIPGRIAEPTGTDGHRPIGRTWHGSHLKSCLVAEAISWSTRNRLPLPHPKLIRSPPPLTIHCWCLCLATLKPDLILAGRSRPRHGQPCSSGSSRGNRCVTSRVGTRVSYEAVLRVLRAARRRYSETCEYRSHLEPGHREWNQQGQTKVGAGPLCGPGPSAHGKCSTGGQYQHGKHLDRGRKPGGKEKQKWGGRR